ncbi:predicted protein [Pyrenophora tritici-repentis Pt-1C-BFP]|uniref:Uncharacterized protein n=1 Tax=Pyrenophora tritici-repentis (strain Pt-1C-BFP) TaxID=426418 RepID=B2W9C0_PYRTR|nr:uncharacterized protein PTRG_06578 [Pyrenophora tritici-repentis Pt-1C-BFP]EDU49498.1 predicted protein [Pyrenophora tritici-repentis Pt-1C-BFP]
MEEKRQAPYHTRVIRMFYDGSSAFQAVSRENDGFKVVTNQQGCSIPSLTHSRLAYNI